MDDIYFENKTHHIRVSVDTEQDGDDVYDWKYVIRVSHPTELNRTAFNTLYRLMGVVKEHLDKDKE